MSKAKGRSFLYDVLMPKIYGIGAAVVIVGALFKIQHWDGADTMLIIGLSTEAIIFFLSAFQPQPHDPDWARVYPQLADDYTGEALVPARATAASGPSVTGKLDEMMRNADITPETINSLGLGLNRLSETAAQMTDMGKAVVATNDYTVKVRAAADQLGEINKAYATTADAISQLAVSTKDAQEYHGQVQSMTRNLGALNAVYEAELQDTNNHLKAMNKFYGNLSMAMENLTDASKDTEQFKEEVARLTQNLHSLNNVYGNMLTAMRS
ncbi:gliding motility-associated protein GldL [Pontibacter ummariensis]|uniref:Gliding motility-associated protein GldL n=1 Tax=Pontibacter ummariensis TaxID=1610492 RepID=A0A239CTT1_9BACT|nr:gliding motility protein GldL [Pontibacter ummariensis]PRY14828.1 gliding motility-associated protein GldL [Pontibacter ummariensis]SNS23625.1 gliding motility-associated protein GldL [Pontibacter ummariensis]